MWHQRFVYTLFADDFGCHPVYPFFISQDSLNPEASSTSSHAGIVFFNSLAPESIIRQANPFHVYMVRYIEVSRSPLSLFYLCVPLFSVMDNRRLRALL